MKNEKNSVAFWDNRATQHYAASNYWPQRRVMERVAIVGDRPHQARSRYVAIRLGRRRSDADLEFHGSA